MAKYHVLGIGYDYDYYSLATAKWTNYDIEFDFADSLAQAKALLSIKDYLIPLRIKFHLFTSHWCFSILYATYRDLSICRNR